MNQGILIPLFALFIWMMAMFTENKFSYFFEGKDSKEQAVGQSGWRRFLIIHNTGIKSAGLGMLWLGFSIATVIADGRQGFASSAFYGIGLIGLIIYVVSRLWPFIK